MFARTATRAFRQDVSGTEMDSLLSVCQKGRSARTFDEGVEQALARILVNPRFVSPFEGEPASALAGKPYRISDFELASRLSFFLWSSIPDDELLNSAGSGRLHEPAELEKQTWRMLADPRSRSLVTSFGDQWLYLRELKSARPETLGFNDNPRQGFAKRRRCCSKASCARTAASWTC